MSNMREAAEQTVNIMNSMAELAIAQVGERNIMNATPDQLCMAQLVIQLKNAMSEYLVAEANEIHEINMKLDRLNKPVAREKAERNKEA